MISTQKANRTALCTVRDWKKLRTTKTSAAIIRNSPMFHRASTNWRM